MGVQVHEKMYKLWIIQQNVSRCKNWGLQKTSVVGHENKFHFNFRGRKMQGLMNTKVY